MLLGGDVPLPLSLAIAVPAAQMAVEGILKREDTSWFKGGVFRAEFRGKTRRPPVARGNQWAL